MIQLNFTEIKELVSYYQIISKKENENYDNKELPNHKNTYAFYDFVNTELNLVEEIYKSQMKETINTCNLKIKELEDKMNFK